MTRRRTGGTLTLFQRQTTGGINIKVVVLESNGEARIISEDTITTSAGSGPDAVTERLIESGRTSTERHGQFQSVGLGVPGLFDKSRAVQLFPNLPGSWTGYPLGDRMDEGLGQSVTMINDASRPSFPTDRCAVVATGDASKP